MTTLMGEFVSDLSVLLTQVSTKFPKIIMVNSTVLARGGIPCHILTKRNYQIIVVCSSLSIVTHDNLFSKGLDLMHDTKHIKKQHLGLLAANLVETIRGRANKARACQV